MDCVDKIWRHPLYQVNYEKLQELEKDRKFCNHTLTHFLDVARLAYIFSLEQGLSLTKKEIYGAALLHDIGRAKQYTDGTPHEVAGAQLAKQILEDSGCFSAEEKEQILSAIKEHRVKESGTSLGEIIYRADKQSRNCFNCDAAAECNWAMEKRNLTIRY